MSDSAGLARVGTFQTRPFLRVYGLGFRECRSVADKPPPLNGENGDSNIKALRKGGYSSQVYIRPLKYS